MTPKQIISILEGNLDAAYAESQSLRETNRELVKQIAIMRDKYGPVMDQVDAMAKAIEVES